MKKRKAGMTIVEVVIAMAILTIVTITAVTIIESSVSDMSKDLATVELRIEASNAIEFFKYSDNLSTFESYLFSSETFSVENGSYVTRKNSYLLAINVSYSEGNHGQISAIGTSQNGSVLFEMRYEK